MGMNHVLVVMAREPWPGAVKTRLIPALGAAGAAALYRAFVQDILESAAAIEGVRRVVCVHPERGAGWFRGLGLDGVAIASQRGASLAERIVSAFADAFATGARAVVVRNSDGPTLPCEVLATAYRRLAAGADVVLAPDQGGGYGLVGLRAPCPSLFLEVPMGTTSVLVETLRRARDAGLRSELLEPSLDVDTPDDLERLRDDLAVPDAAARCPRTEAFLRALPAFASSKGQGFPSGAHRRPDEGRAAPAATSGPREVP